MKIKIIKINLINENLYKITFQFKSDFNELIIMTQNVYLNIKNKNPNILHNEIIENLEIPTCYHK